MPLLEEDRKWIAKAVAPFDFDLTSGVVNVRIPENLGVETRGDDGRIIRSDPLVPTQQEIESRVAFLKKMDHRSTLAASFKSVILLLDSILIAEMRTVGGASPDPDVAIQHPHVRAWLSWRDEFFQQLDAAQSPADVLVPDFPPLPRHLIDERGLLEYARSIGALRISD